MRSLLFAILMGIGVLPAQAAVIDTFTLDMNLSNGSIGVDSNAVLASGTQYIVTVSGTFEIGCISSDPCPTDAEYYVPSTGSNAGNAFSKTGFDLGPIDVAVRIDGNKIDWGPFQPTRIYSTLLIGLGSTIHVDYLDSFYGDNSGELSVSISTLNGVVPIPGALPLFLSGLAVLGLLRRRPA